MRRYDEDRVDIRAIFPWLHYHITSWILQMADIESSSKQVEYERYESLPPAFCPPHHHNAVWEMLLRDNYSDKKEVEVLGIKTNRSERPPILPKLKMRDLPTAPDFRISEGELADRIATIDGISNADIERAASSFMYSTDTFSNRITNELEQCTYIVILEVEVRLLQDILRVIPTLKEEELQDWQNYMEAMRAEIDYRLAGNSYRHILLPKRSYAELRVTRIR